MDCLTLLRFALVKLKRFEFYEFSEEIFSRLKSYKGLFEVVQLKFRRTILLPSYSYEIPKVTDFENEIIELYYLYYSINDNMFEFTELPTRLILAYDRATTLSQSPQTHVSAELVNHIITVIWRRFGRYISKFFNKVPITPCSNYESFDFSCIFSAFLENKYDRCLQLISTCEVEEGSIPFFHYIRSRIEFEKSSDFLCVKDILRSIENAYTKGKMSVEDLGKDLQQMYRLHQIMVKNTLLLDNSVDPQLYKNFSAISSTLTLTTLELDGMETTLKDYLKHRLHLLDVVKDGYLDYLITLNTGKSRFLSRVYYDYMLLNHLERQYHCVVDFFVTHRDFILFEIFRKDTQSMFDLIYIVTKAYLMTHRLCELGDLQNFLDTFDMTPEVRKRIEETSFFTEPLPFTKALESFASCGFSLLRLTEDCADLCCLICFDDLYHQRSIPMVFCNNCKQNLGHIDCIQTWLKAKGKGCPNCRHFERDFY